MMPEHKCDSHHANVPHTAHEGLLSATREQD